MPKKSLGSGAQNRDSRVSGNTQFFFLGLSEMHICVNRFSRQYMEYKLSDMKHHITSLTL